MKRIGNIYEKIYDLDNLREAHRNAKRDKSHYREVKMVDSDEEYYLRIVQNMLKSKTYRVSDYTHTKINDKGKVRELSKLPYFPDRIIQWAILLQIEDVFNNMLIPQTCASLKNRGIHKASRFVDKYLKDKDKTRYCLKIDVHHFYASINHNTLKQLLLRKFKDADLLWLLFLIIDSTDGDAGIPIGSYLSQYLANFYLSYFDHWCKEEKQCKYYVRYMDDVVIFDKDKQNLHVLLNEIKQYLSDNLKLELKYNYQIFPTFIRGVDFVGYRHFGDFKLLRKSTCKNFKNKMLKINNKQDVTYKDFCCFYSYKGWLEFCNSYRLYLKYCTPIENKINTYYCETVKGDKLLHKFSDFAENKIQKGEKIKIDDILGQTIQIISYKISDSKYQKGNSEKCLVLQIKYNDEDRIVFTGSGVLIEQVETYKDELPFETQIIKNDRFYTFN